MPTMDGNDPAAVERAASLLARGELVAFPTETVYGLGARADDDHAVVGIYKAKGRPVGHPLIVHVASIEAATAFADVGVGVGADDACDPEAASATATRLIAAFWPGPLTVIVPRRPGVAEAAAGGQSSIGLRMPEHPVALALLHAAARHGVAGVAAPSANRYGRVSPTSAGHVASEFGPALAVLDGGDCKVGIESSIVDCTRWPPSLLRPGQIDRDAIEAVLGHRLVAPDDTSPRAPGTLASHYAPQARVRIFDLASLQRELAALAKTNAASTAAPTRLAHRGAGHPAPERAVYSRAAPPPGSPVWHQRMPDDAGAVAHELFAVLRAFDALGVASIWVEDPPPDPAWEGVRDRLHRAAA